MNLCVAATYDGDDRQRRRQQQLPSSDAANLAAVVSSHPVLTELNREQERLFRLLGSDPKRFPTSNCKLILSHVRQMMHIVQQWKHNSNQANSNTTKDKHIILRTASIIIDESIRAVTKRSFSPHNNNSNSNHYADVDRVFCGLDVLELQLQKGSSLVSPYNTVTRSTWVGALRALHKLKAPSSSQLHQQITTHHSSWQKRRAHVAFSILKRLISGIGIRHSNNHNNNNNAAHYLQERDFCSVLQAFVDIHHMDMAHRVMALQERTSQAPPLSSVPYSIMIKAYGRNGDAPNVDRVWKRALRSLNQNVDVILCNSAMDAFINSQQLSKAQQIFTSMTTSQTKHQLPLPNIRTYNTMLKGYAKDGFFHDATKLYHQMQQTGINHDHITINTLVSAAVKSGSFSQAEQILSNSTSTTSTTTTTTNANANAAKQYSYHQQHPNVEAYTELLDGYAKAGMLNQAMHTLKVMRQRGVQPNDFTYSSILQALAKFGKIPQAKKMLHYMEFSEHIKPTVVTYNAFLTGLLTSNIQLQLDLVETSKNPKPNNREDSTTTDTYDTTALSIDEREEEAFELLNQMTSSGIIPNEVTVATLVDFLTLRCEPARMKEAEMLISQLEKTSQNRSYSYRNDKRISTVLIKAYAKSKDFASATQVYSQIKYPDVVALNAYLDTCCKCMKMKTALETFQTHCATKQQQDRQIAPDVITYTVIISALLDYKDNPKATQKARQLYWELKHAEGKFPDTGLVDTILTAMITGSRLGVNHKTDIGFTLDVLKDAESLDWPRGYLERRKKIVSKIIRLGKFESRNKEEDPLFKKKGWNTVNSGFRLWGNTNDESSVSSPRDRNKGTDQFLESKGWNDVDSGFRLL